MARTVIDIDEEALANAQQLTGLRKKRHTPLGECLNVRPNLRRRTPVEHSQRGRAGLTSGCSRF